MVTEIEQITQSLIDGMQAIIQGNNSKLQFDRTIKATIINNDEKTKGCYVVDDGSTTFYAYSDNTSYPNKAQVYVKIPNNDFNNVKLIIGRCELDGNDRYVYTSPLDTFVEGDGKTYMFNPPSPQNGLLANGDPDFQNVTEKFEVNLAGYTTMGLSAEFMSWLKNRNLIKGNYGIVVSLFAGEEQFNYYLDSSKMYGDIYNFETYYKQDMTFDISNVSDKIDSAMITFYQLDNFISRGYEVPYIIEDNYKDFKDLFVRNIILSFGYDESDFPDDKIVLSTTGNLQYDSSVSDENYTRNLKAKWCHKDENKVCIFLIRIRIIWIFIIQNIMKMMMKNCKIFL